MAGEVQVEHYAISAAGVPINGATVNAYARNTVTPVIDSTVTDANGRWRFNNDGGNALPAPADEGYDYEVTSGSTVLRYKYDDQVAYRRFEAIILALRDSGDHSHLLFMDAPVLTGDRTWTYPDVSDTFVGLVAAQTLTNKILNDVSLNDVHANTVHVEVRNESGGTLVAGTAVYASGYSVGEEKILVTEADASVLATMPAIGIVEEDILNNATGAAVQSGRLQSIDTSSFSAGDALYVSETAGELTDTKPTGDALVQKVAIVLRSHASNGVIEVFGAGRVNDVPNVVTSDIEFEGVIDIQGGYANGGGAPYDGVVDAGGGGNWTTAQAGDDALDAGSYTMLIKAGAYSTLTVSTDNVTIVCEPGCTFSGAVVLSGSNIRLVLGNESQMSGLVTLSGNQNQLVCENGVDFTAGILLSGDDNLLDGGGWGTLSNGGTTAHGVSVTGSRNIVQNMSAQTTGGGTNDLNAFISATGTDNSFINCRAVDSDVDGFRMGGARHLVQGCTVIACDDHGIFSETATSGGGRLVGNMILSASDHGILTSNNGDDLLVVGNTVVASVNDAIELATGSENCLVVGNRLISAVNDLSGTSTVANNEVGAFG